MSSTAPMMRDCISRTDSPPGNRTADGVTWTSFHRSVPRSSSILRPDHSP